MTDRALLLTPGAGTGADHPSLVTIEDALAPMPVLRWDFPYRREGRKAPDRAPKLIASITEGASQLAERTGVDRTQIILGGRSMGGRMCSMAVAEGLPAAALVLIAYPLHPPGRPDRLRIEHLPQIGVPCLFVSGDRDPFGTPEELESHTSSILGPVTHVWMAGKRHDLKGVNEEVAAQVSSWLRDL